MLTRFGFLPKYSASESNTFSENCFFVRSDKFSNFFIKKSLNVIKNKKNAEVTKIEFKRKLIFKLFREKIF